MYRTFALLLLCGATAAPQDAAKFIPTPTPIPGETYRPIENIPLTPPVEDILESSARAETELFAETTEAITERDEVRTTAYEVRTTPSEVRTTPYEVRTTPSDVRTTPYEVRTTPSEVRTTPPELRTKPRFHSKLSYFEKPEFSAVLTNLVEKPARRRFRSRCRCEKISNCPKLQISVPRCPDEQFMCCF